MSDLTFLKLGGSLITDKTRIETIRPAVIERIADEISQAFEKRPEMKLLLGHGSGSFGHVAADKYRTREGVTTDHEWRGFAEVSDAAARLNQIVRSSLRQVGLPAVSFQPSASAACRDGTLTYLDVDAISRTLEAGLLPVIYGDVAYDTVRGGTIVSTEELFAYMALKHSLKISPKRILLAGETPGVIDSDGAVISELSRRNLDSYASALGKSRGTDVTGGMATKVNEMINLVDQLPGLTIQIFSGLEPGALMSVLEGKPLNQETRIVFS